MRRKREESVRPLFVWTEDLKHVVPLYTWDRTDRGSRKKELPIGGMERAGECADSREKNDASRVKRVTETKGDSGGTVGARGSGRSGHPFAHAVAVLFLCPVQVGEGQRGGCR